MRNILLALIKHSLTGILLIYHIGFNRVCAQTQIVSVQKDQENSSAIAASIEIDYLAEPIFNPVGGQEQASSLLQGLWLQMKVGRGLNIEKSQWRELDHWSIATEVAIVRGNSNYYKEIGAAYPLQTLTASGQWLTEASLRREAGSGNYSLRAGVFTLNPEFMVSDIFNYYVHSAINDTFNEEVLGIPIAPLASPGVMLTVGNSENAKGGEFKLGLFKIVATNQFGISAVENSPPIALNGSVALLQWKKILSLQPLSKESQPSKISGLADDLPSPNLMLGGYWSQTYSSAQDTSQPGTSIPLGQNRTIYGSITLPLLQSKGAVNHRRLWVAGRIGLDWNNNPAPYFLGAGLVTQGLIKSRPSDISGFAIASTGFSPTINPGLSQESVIEVNHLIRISPKLGLKPFVQLILNPGGSGKIAPILAPGLQFSASL